MKEQPANSPSYNVFSKLKSLSPTLFALDRKPLIPDDYSFPIESLSALLSKHFSKEVSITLDRQEWLASDDLQKEKNSNHLRSLGCSVFGITSPLTILFPEDAMVTLLADFLNSDVPHILLQPPAFVKTFEAFIFAHIAASIKECCSSEKMELRLIEEGEDMSHDGYFTYRYTMRIGKVATTVILALSPSFLDQLHTLPQSKEKTPKQWLSTLPVFPICIEAARAHVPLSLLKKLRPGDILFVDFPFFIPGSERARVILTYRGSPLFRAKVKNGVIKLLEMANNQQAFQPISALLSTQKEEPSMNPLNARSSTPPRKENLGPTLESPEENFSDVETVSESQTSVQESQQEHISINELPLLVIVQLKELSMTLEQLQSLQPGNLLDLDIHPEHAIVQLSVQGHIIGEGDLIRIGDKIGVQVRTMGAL